MKILQIIGVETNAKSIRKVERVVEVTAGGLKGHQYRNSTKKESKRGIKQDNKNP